MVITLERRQSLAARALAGGFRAPGHQDYRTVRHLRVGVGLIGILLPAGLIAGNWVAGDKVIVPASMSGSYYTSTRDLFVGALCALGVFLLGYRHSERQNRCTLVAGGCAVAVAFAPTAPAAPASEPAWINYLHHSAAGLLIGTLGLFCLVVFADYARPGADVPATVPGRVRAWLDNARDLLAHHWRGRIYLGGGLIVFVAGLLALYTGIWPAGWSTGWPSLFTFEAIAVFGFGAAWLTAGTEPAAAGPDQD